MSARGFRDQALRRIRIAEGHLRKVEKMIKDQDYCLDIIHQSRAVQAALKKLDKVILHGHLHSCVLKDTHKDKGKNEKLVSEILELFDKKE